MAASALTGAALAAGCAPGRRGSYGFLNDADAGRLAALCDQIIPEDDYPSASQAGVLTYIDRQLTRHYKRFLQTYLDGLAQANSMSRENYGVELTEASEQQKFEVARAIEKENPHFFELVRSHTMQGYYGSPRHGGNRDAVSWRMLGLAEPPVRGRAQYDLTAGSRP